jgi:hypothetical protein
MNAQGNHSVHLNGYRYLRCAQLCSAKTTVIPSTRSARRGPLRPLDINKGKKQTPESDSDAGQKSPTRTTAPRLSVTTTRAHRVVSTSYLSPNNDPPRAQPSESRKGKGTRSSPPSTEPDRIPNLDLFTPKSPPRTSLIQTPSPQRLPSPPSRTLRPRLFSDDFGDPLQCRGNTLKGVRCRKKDRTGYCHWHKGQASVPGEHRPFHPFSDFQPVVSIQCLQLLLTKCPIAVLNTTRSHSESRLGHTRVATSHFIHPNAFTANITFPAVSKFAPPSCFRR